MESREINDKKYIAINIGFSTNGGKDDLSRLHFPPLKGYKKS